MPFKDVIIPNNMLKPISQLMSKQRYNFLIDATTIQLVLKWTISNLLLFYIVSKIWNPETHETRNILFACTRSYKCKNYPLNLKWISS